MKLHQIAVAVAAISMAGATFATGNQAATTSPSSSDGSYSANQQGQQAGTSSTQAGGRLRTQTGASSSQAGMSSSQPAGTAGAQSNPALVRSVQQALKDKGHDAGAIDGQMGPSTESALRSFQQAQGLPPSGTLDQQTLSALNVQQDQGAMPNQASPSGSQSQASPMSNTRVERSSQVNNVTRWRHRGEFCGRGVAVPACAAPQVAPGVRFRESFVPSFSSRLITLISPVASR